MEMKNEKRNVFCFPVFYKNEKQMRALRIQSKNLVNMKTAFDPLNFVIQFIKNMK